ncbi:MAG: hypothetical protein AB7Q29_19295 [Vicinamibacterales bacterium]
MKLKRPAAWMDAGKECCADALAALLDPPPQKESPGGDPHGR